MRPAGFASSDAPAAPFPRAPDPSAGVMRLTRVFLRPILRSYFSGGWKRLITGTERRNVDACRKSGPASARGRLDHRAGRAGDFRVRPGTRHVECGPVAVGLARLQSGTGARKGAAGRRGAG